jgi:hypothetical protein
MQKKYSFPDHVIKSSQMRAKLRLRNETYIHRTHTTHTHNTHTHTHTHTHTVGAQNHCQSFFLLLIGWCYKRTNKNLSCTQLWVVVAYKNLLYMRL